MKYCPTCETRYDEEILRFCMKDGTPLLEEEEPKFVAMPSESLDEVEDDAGDVTVVRRNVPVPESEAERPRIVVPTYEEARRQESRARVAPPYYPPPKANTAKVVILTILGTLAVVGLIGAGVWMLQRGNNNNSNVNANTNTNANVNANTNLGIDTNFNFNLNANFNSSGSNLNTNINANVKTPTPTPKPSPSVTPSPTPDDDATPTPSRTPIPTPQPTIIRPGGSPTPRPVATPARNTNSGMLNGMAVNLARPVYPPLAKQVGASGQVRVQVSVDGSGNIVSARAISGHPLLRSAAESAARQSKMRPDAANSTGQLLYNFKNN